VILAFQLKILEELHLGDLASRGATSILEARDKLEVGSTDLDIKTGTIVRSGK